MQWRKLLLGFSFYYLMVASVLAIFLFASVVDLNTASNVFKAQSKAFLKVADMQLFLAMAYILVGLFMAILLKRKTAGLSNASFGAWYALHFIVFILPSFAYFTLLVV